MAFFDFLSDQKGLFQGGEQGRAFGRVRDIFSGDRNTPPPRTRDLTYKTTSSGEQLPESTTNLNTNRRVAKDDWDMRAIQAEEAWKGREDDPEKAKKFNMMMANRLAKTFDPKSSTGVQALQTYLQRAGVKDYEGKDIKADAMFGKRTESALRNLQNMYERPNEGLGNYGFNNTPPPYNITSVEGYPNYPGLNQQGGGYRAEDIGDINSEIQREIGQDYYGNL